MASSKTKYRPYLGNGVPSVNDLSSNPKVVLKSADPNITMKAKPSSSRPASSKLLLVTSMSSRILSEEKIYLARSQHPEPVIQPGIHFIKKTILSGPQVSRMSANFKPGQNIRNKNETVNSELTLSKTRLSTTIEGEPNRAFRIRATINHTPNPPRSEILKTDWSQSSEVKIRSMPSLEAESTLYQKGCSLDRMMFNVPNPQRIELPLLIVHFEGVIGTCLVVNRKRKEKGNAENGNPIHEYFFIKKGIKEELKQLSRNFLIGVVFPSMSSRYKEVAKYFVKKKLAVDGIYFKLAANSGMEGKNDIAEFVLDYNIILSDFRTVKLRKQVVILLPLNLNKSVIKGSLLCQEDEDETVKPVQYDKSSFLHFFPKIQENMENFKIICVPNFLLEEKNQNFAKLFRERFSFISKAANKILSSLNIEKATYDTPISASQNEQSSSTTTGSPQSQEVERSETYEAQDECKVKIQTEAEKGCLKALNFNHLIKELEKLKEFKAKIRRIEAIKESNGIIKGQSINLFECSQARQKVLEDLTENQKTSRSGKGRDVNNNNNTANNRGQIASIVTSLFNNNSYLYRLYDRSGFYNNKKDFSIISDLAKFASQKGEFNCKFGEEEEDDNDCIIEIRRSFKLNKGRGVNPLGERHASLPNCSIKESFLKGKKRPQTNEKQSCFERVNKEKQAHEEFDAFMLDLIKNVTRVISIYLEDES